MTGTPPRRRSRQVAFRVSALAAIAACSLGVGPAGARQAHGPHAFSWIFPDAIGLAAGPEWGRPQVAISPAGDATAVWAGLDGAVQVARKPAGQAWTAPVDLTNRGGGAVTEPLVTMDGRGGATVVWLQSDGARNTVSVSTRPRDGSWSAPRRISVAGRNASAPQLAGTLRGGLLVAWRDRDGVALAERRVGRQWSQPRLVSGDPGTPSPSFQYSVSDAFIPRIALAPSGAAVVAWMVAPDNGPAEVHVVTRDAGGQFEQPRLLATSLPTRPSGVVVDGAGISTLIFQRPDQALVAATRVPHGPWRSMRILAAAGTNPSNAALAIAESGTATIAWSSVQERAFSIVSRTKARSGAWGPPIVISRLGHDAIRPRLAVNAAGDILVAWAFVSRKTGQGGNEAAMHRAGAHWSLPKQAPEAESREPSGVAIDAAGNGLLIAGPDDNDEPPSVFATSIDGAAPVITHLVVPRIGFKGRAVRVSVAATDMRGNVFSSPTWTFGDGTTADGLTLSHTYRRSGTFIVTVRVDDSLGNERRATRRIVIGDTANKRSST